MKQTSGIFQRATLREHVMWLLRKPVFILIQSWSCLDEGEGNTICIGLFPMNEPFILFLYFTPTLLPTICKAGDLPLSYHSFLFSCPWKSISQSVCLYKTIMLNNWEQDQVISHNIAWLKQIPQAWHNPYHFDRHLHILKIAVSKDALAEDARPVWNRKPAEKDRRLALKISKMNCVHLSNQKRWCFLLSAVVNISTTQTMLKTSEHGKAAFKTYKQGTNISYYDTTEVMFTCVRIFSIIIYLLEKRPQDEALCPLDDVIQVTLLRILTCLWNCLSQVNTDTRES